MEMRKGISPPGSKAFVAEGAKGAGPGTAGPGEPTLVTWYKSVNRFTFENSMNFKGVRT
jgi:hypothetical protein